MLIRTGGDIRLIFGGGNTSEEDPSYIEDGVTILVNTVTYKMSTAVLENTRTEDGVLVYRVFSR